MHICRRRRLSFNISGAREENLQLPVRYIIWRIRKSSGKVASANQDTEDQGEEKLREAWSDCLQIVRCESIPLRSMTAKKMPSETLTLGPHSLDMEKGNVTLRWYTKMYRWLLNTSSKSQVGSSDGFPDSPRKHEPKQQIRKSRKVKEDTLPSYTESVMHFSSGQWLSRIWDSHWQSESSTCNTSTYLFDDEAKDHHEWQISQSGRSCSSEVGHGSWVTTVNYMDAF